MSDPEAVIIDTLAAVKQYAHAEIELMLDSAKKQRCDTEQTAQLTEFFLEGVRGIYQENMACLKACKEAGEILSAKLKSFKNRKEIFRAPEPQSSLEDL